MKNQIKIKGLKKSVGTFNKWIGHAKIMYNKAENELWTDVFTSCNEWKEYHDENIIIVVSKASVSMLGNWDTITMTEVQKRVEYFLKNGYLDY